MKYKTLILTINVLIFTLGGFAQNDVAGIIINGKTIGEVTIAGSPAVVNIDELKYKNVAKAVLNLKQSAVVSAYKRSIQVTDENENELYQVNESKSQPGTYNINTAAIRQKLLNKKMLKVFLLENPVNERMSIPSRRKLMIELHLQ